MPLMAHLCYISQHDDNARRHVTDMWQHNANATPHVTDIRQHDSNASRHVIDMWQHDANASRHVTDICQLDTNAITPTCPPRSTWMMPMQGNTSPTIYLDGANASRHVPNHLPGWCQCKPTRPQPSTWMMPLKADTSPDISLDDANAIHSRMRWGSSNSTVSLLWPGTNDNTQTSLPHSLKRLYLTHLNVFTSLA